LQRVFRRSANHLTAAPNTITGVSLFMFGHAASTTPSTIDALIPTFNPPAKLASISIGGEPVRVFTVFHFLQL